MKSFKRKSALYSLCIITFFSMTSISEAKNGEAISIISHAQLMGLTLKSTAQEIESYLSEHPELECQYGDLPERRSMLKTKPPIPRHRSWRCSNANHLFRETLSITMAGEGVTSLRFEARFETEDEQMDAMKQIRRIHKGLKVAGLGDKTPGGKNYVDYKEEEHTGGSAGASYSQRLQAKTTLDCNGYVSYYTLDMLTNKTVSIGRYEARIVAERNHEAVPCTQ